MNYILQLCVDWSFHSKIVDLDGSKPTFHTVEFKEVIHAKTVGKALQERLELLQAPFKVFVVGERVNVVDSKIWENIFAEI